ncbi:MAG: DUF2946 family protein [Burkholderiaceae bacterium]|nr:DUF2946 family protein [Burkholderiaceae bacterium]
MLFSIRQRARVAWFAIVTTLLSALAPSVSQAMVAAAAGAPWARVLGEICTIGGLVQAPIVASEPASEPRPATRGPIHFEHCPYCLSHAGGAAPPPEPSLDFAIPGAALPPPPDSSRTSLARPRWRAALARAPPPRG